MAIWWGVLCLCVTPQLVKLQIRIRSHVCYVLGGYRHLRLFRKGESCDRGRTVETGSEVDTRGHDIFPFFIFFFLEKI